MSYVSKKIVSAKDLVEAEKQAFLEKKVSEENLTHSAAEAVVRHIKKIFPQKSGRKIFLLAGKGNKAADGFLSAILLKNLGYDITAFTFFEESENFSLCQKFRKEFAHQGGQIKKIDEITPLDQYTLIIDALFGTGFFGKLEGKILKTIQEINSQKKAFALSIDLPTGVDGNTGKVETDAFVADYTITFTLPKLGLYLNEGPNFSGKVFVENIGLPENFTQPIKTSYYLFDEKFLKTFLPPLIKKRHKYQAGYVIGVSGSLSMSGAANLAGLAALRAGAGIVKIFSKEHLQNFSFELIQKTFNSFSYPSLLEECHHASSVFLGPGTGRDEEMATFFSKLIPEINVPTVLDADALFFLAHYPKKIKLPKKTILTPHKQEMLRLLHCESKKEKISDEIFWEKCQQFAKENEVTLILKGYPTIIFDSLYETLVCMRGDPTMATAGSGDVLTGILSALLAQKLLPYEAAILGVYLHAIAGEYSAKVRGGYGIIASDLIENLSYAFKAIKKME